MERREFLAGTLAASALAAAPAVGAQAQESKQREYYQIRRYFMQSGSQTSITEKYISEALIPSLAGKGGPVGAFRLEIGPQTPTFYVLIPLASAAAAASLELDLSQNETYLKAAEPFWSAPATAPAFVRVDSSLHIAFEGWPKVTPPEKGKRIFQLRTYESPSHRDHVVKVQMFNSGEFQVFKDAGFHPVFFGDTLIGERMPSLTYMLSLESTAELDAKWGAFRDNPAWKKLSADQKYAFEPIVSNITNLILSPLAASQI
ncbi:MAG: NIPSNAP family protein [Acidobacteria bacterium]|nr:NIPSNAP family protein [Acidobacteriota bacterium]